MDIKTLLDMYVRYGVISENQFSIEELMKVVDDELEPSDLVLNLLHEIRPDAILIYSLAKGGWDDGNLIGEFYSNVEAVVDISNGSVKIENLELIPPINSDGVEDPYHDMTISFVNDGKKQEWVFSQSDNDNFLYGFTKWAYSALDGNFLFLDDDFPIGYFLPKELIKELESLGIKNEVKQVSRSLVSSKLKDKYLQSWKTQLKEEDLVEINPEELFNKLKEISTVNNFAIPSLLERKREANRYVCVKLLENKILARPFRFDIEVVNYVEENYSNIFKENNTESNVVFFDLINNIAFSPIGNGTWKIRQNIVTS